jgi:uncharacterized OB-fold protein
MPEVKSKKDVQAFPASEGDLWRDFREVERLTLTLTQTYTHTLGKYSRFFVELENGRFMATRCPSCGRTYAPPRPLCPGCLAVTVWVELAGTGTVETFSVLHFSPGSNADVAGLATPYVLAYVLMDGASTLFPHLLDADPSQVSMGMRVKVAYVAHAVEHPIHLMRFVPLETA